MKTEQLQNAQHRDLIGTRNPCLVCVARVRYHSSIAPAKNARAVPQVRSTTLVVSRAQNRALKEQFWMLRQWNAKTSLQWKETMSLCAPHRNLSGMILLNPAPSAKLTNLIGMDKNVASVPLAKLRIPPMEIAKMSLLNKTILLSVMSTKCGTKQQKNVWRLMVV